MNYNGPLRVCPYISHMLLFDVDFLSPINFFISFFNKIITKMGGKFMLALFSIEYFLLSPKV